MVINLDEKRTFKFKISMANPKMVEFAPYDGNRELNVAWEDNEGVHIVVMAKNAPKAMIAGVDMIMEQTRENNKT